MKKLQGSVLLTALYFMSLTVFLLLLLLHDYQATATYCEKLSQSYQEKTQVILEKIVEKKADTSKMNSSLNSVTE
ncbi:hypothetical protein [Enterococcus canis]|uniref:hypothetical protein n=1 Tax=Enterococcus canis TaxID=214095 RepID=UPI000837A171|nr:hypothetical protein [Enterococcus canis]